MAIEDPEMLLCCWFWNPHLILFSYCRCFGTYWFNSQELHVPKIEITFVNGCFALKVLRCQYKGGRRNNLEGLSANCTIADLQEKIWLLTDVPPHAQRSNHCQFHFFTIIYHMLLMMALTRTWFAPVGYGRYQRCLFPKNKVKKLCLVICIKQKQSKVKAEEVGSCDLVNQVFAPK